MNFIKSLIVVCAVGLSVALPIYLLEKGSEAMSVENSLWYQSSKFKNGDIVKMKAFGHIGMIVGVRCYEYACEYSVRFSAVQSSTEYHIFGSGGNIDVTPVALVKHIREFELERAA